MYYYFPKEEENKLEELEFKLIRIGILDFDIQRLGGGSMLTIKGGEKTKCICREKTESYKTVF